MADRNKSQTRNDMAVKVLMGRRTRKLKTTKIKDHVSKKEPKTKPYYSVLRSLLMEISFTKLKGSLQEEFFLIVTHTLNLGGQLKLSINIRRHSLIS